MAPWHPPLTCTPFDPTPPHLPTRACLLTLVSLPTSTRSTRNARPAPAAASAAATAAPLAAALFAAAAALAASATRLPRPTSSSRSLALVGAEMTAPSTSCAHGGGSMGRGGGGVGRGVRRSASILRRSRRDRDEMANLAVWSRDEPGGAHVSVAMKSPPAGGLVAYL
jgi:hypothetical protein